MQKWVFLIVDSNTFFFFDTASVLKINQRMLDKNLNSKMNIKFYTFLTVMIVIEIRIKMHLKCIFKNNNNVYWKKIGL